MGHGVMNTNEGEKEEEGVKGCVIFRERDRRREERSCGVKRIKR